MWPKDAKGILVFSADLWCHESDVMALAPTVKKTTSAMNGRQSVTCCKKIGIDWSNA